MSSLNSVRKNGIIKMFGCNKRENNLKLIGMLIMFVALSFADSFQGGTLTTSTTPTQFSSTLGDVQKIVIHMVPGAGEKVYIGSSTMNTSTLAGVFKVLYPNSSGGLSDSWTLQDNSGANGVNTSAIYIAGQLGGYPITWETLTSSTTPTKFLTLVQSGPCAGNLASPSSGCWITPSGSGYDVLQVAVVPGMSGKIDLALAESGSPGYAIFDYLYPNNGTVTGTITEKWETYAVATNGLTGVWIPAPEISGEYPVVGVWQRQ